MRKTRASSNAENVGRSLRSAQSEEFYEIPTKFRSRLLRPEPKSSEKFSPTRRSSRLSGDDFELQELGSRTRKRRLVSCQNDESVKITHYKNGKDTENGLKPAKLLRPSDQKAGSLPHRKENGLCGSPRQRISESSKDARGSNATKRPTPRSLPSNHDIQQIGINSTPKRTRFSPRGSRSSPARLETNCRVVTVSQEWNPGPTHECVNGQNSENNTSVETISSKPTSEIEIADDCKCTKVLKAHCEMGSTKCELCGKLKSCKMRKNGSVANGSLDALPAFSRSLRSGGQANTISSIVSMKCTGSPVAAEEATSAESVNGTSEDDSVTNNLRGNRRKSETDHEQPVPCCTDAFQDATPKSELTNEDKGSDEQFSSTGEMQTSTVCVNNQPNATVGNGVVNSTSNNEGEEHHCDIAEPRKQDCSDCKTEDGRDLSVFDELSCAGLDLLSDGEDYDSYRLSKRKMNLRSSGVRCDPDFYTLSLDLLIKRPRTRPNSFNKSLNETNGDAEPIRKNELDAEEASNINEKQMGELACSLDDAHSVFSIKSNLQKEKESNITGTDNEDAANFSPSLCTQSTPQRPRGLHKVQNRGRGRVPRGLSNAKLGRSPIIKMVANDPSEPPPLYTEEPPSGPDVYYFESDHVALKHNEDYHKLLCTVSILESQRYNCLGHIKSLETRKTEALDEPIAFVENLQKNERVDLPSVQKVPDLPNIEWSKYSSVYGTFDHVFSSEIVSSPKKPATRKVKINFETGVPLQSTKNNSSNKNKDGSLNNRSQSFRVAWTVEEQRKLEELLLKFPSEEIEFNRYRKIAAELENRTPLQVQSRVQKYFIKLAKAGLPVPGHMPRLERISTASSSRSKRARSHPHQQLTKMSTFFPTFHVPVKMKDDDPGNSVSNEDEDGWTIDQEQISDEEDVPEEMRFSDEYLEILRLKRIRREHLRVLDNNGHQALAQHVGYECDMCNCDPIEGVRYHCIDCPPEECVDLCQSCIRLQGQFETEKHKASHRMQAVYKAQNFVDDDYLKFVSRSGEYNYLDPNFFPPNT